MRRILLLPFLCWIGYVSPVFAQNFGSFASAMFMEVNGVTQFYNCSGHGGPNAIGSLQFTGSFGTFIQGGGQLRIRGAEIKTWRNSSANVCTPRLNYRIYPAGPPTGSFTNFNINFFCNCSGSAFPMSCGGGPCGGNDQKWQTPGSGMGVNIDLTTFSPGTYELEVYYEIPGNNSGTSGCGDTQFDSNSGANYKMSFTIQAAPMPVTFGDVNVIRAGKNHLIRWSTYQEVNNSHFEILASANGKDYSLVGNVTSNGDSRVLRNYEYLQSENTGYYRYYKIRQVDFDGKFSYSPVAHVSPEALKTGDFTIYPNPAADFIHVHSPEEGTMELIDITGNILKQISIVRGENLISLHDISYSGMLYARLKNEYSVMSVQRIILK